MDVIREHVEDGTTQTHSTSNLTDVIDERMNPEFRDICHFPDSISTITIEPSDYLELEDDEMKFNDNSAAFDRAIIKSEPNHSQNIVKKSDGDPKPTVQNFGVKGEKAQKNLELKINCEKNRKRFSKKYMYQPIPASDKYLARDNALRPHVCKVCTKQFKTRMHLDQHMRTHTGEKPYKCGICNKLFGQQSNLDQHVRTHTGEKPYKCDSCRKCFRQQSNLDQHKRFHAGEKPYVCEFCHKSYVQMSGLQMHMTSCNGT